MPTKFAHVNLIAKDWKQLVTFYQEVLDCQPIPPKRDLSGKWLDQATGIEDTQIDGIHLRLPGYGKDGPTFEIFQYRTAPEHPTVQPNTPGFSHIAFAVDDVAATAEAILQAGGSAVGVLTEREIPGAGVVTFQYLRDPEGNIIEIQSWK
jgi:predicted enzyme related to lactoylglutathione lyase